MQHLEGSGTPILYIWDARFLKVITKTITTLQRIICCPRFFNGRYDEQHIYVQFYFECRKIKCVGNAQNGTWPYCYDPETNQQSS